MQWYFIFRVKDICQKGAVMRCLNVILLVAFISAAALAQVFAQIYADDTLFIGNPDGSPLHVPYEGIVNIPIWMNPYGVGDGFINLITHNYAVSQRLGGNFNYPWPYMFSDPIYYPETSAQALSFWPINSPDSFVHLADFTFRMHIDTSYLGDTLQIMEAMNIFTDTLGHIVIIFTEIISPVVIEPFTSLNETEVQPTTVTLLQNYPNPFNAVTTIEFSVTKADHVTIAIYDLLGKRIETLVDEVKGHGRHQIAWDASGYSSGVYFYRIEAGDFTETKKMVYLK